ncbi:hypothetical protein BT93_B2797 [Corymbia citriodora subsp. variegata]|nr:hypothetical protein BT93_B2797 [Corymbia citriodora subsp. variegata]
MTHSQDNASSLENGKQEIEKTNQKKKSYGIFSFLIANFAISSISFNPQSERHCKAKDTDAVPASLD